MTSGCNKFNYFPDNQLTKIKLCPPTSLFLPPRIFVTHFALSGVPLDAPARFLVRDFCFHSSPSLSSVFSPFSVPSLSYLSPPVFPFLPPLFSEWCCRQLTSARYFATALAKCLARRWTNSSVIFFWRGGKVLSGNKLTQSQSHFCRRYFYWRERSNPIAPSIPTLLALKAFSVLPLTRNAVYAT